MTPYRLEILITPRPGLLDPEGKAIHHALEDLGFDGVEEVRMGKAVYLDVRAGSSEEAREAGREMCRKMLANPVTEDFRVEVLGEASTETKEPAEGAAPAGGAGP